MGDDLSPEATVAAEAAASAVEELHAREEVVSEAVAASETASIAAMEAEDAHAAASQAETYAEASYAASAETAEVAETAAVIAYATAEEMLFLRAELEADRVARDAALSDIRQFIDERIPAAPPEPIVEEVEAHDGTADIRNPSGGESSEGNGAQTGAQSSGPEKKGLRFRSRK